MISPLRYVSLFSGAGGLDIGLERAGLRAASLCEIEEVFCETLRINQSVSHADGLNYFDGTQIINADIRSLSGRNLISSAHLDLLVGGPPCQAFSSSGKQLSVLDPRGTLINEYIRMVEELRPRMFLFENVRGLVTARDARGEPGGVIRSLLERFHEIGYSCRATLLNAADYGSFQRRVRCFIVGSSRGAAPQFPSATHSDIPDILHLPWRSLRSFLEQFADRNADEYVLPTEELANQLKHLRDGCGLKSVGRTEKTRPGGHWGYRQGTFIANLDLPARTVTGSSSQDWVRWGNVLRRLTLQEVKTLQGFPRDWEIVGTKAQQFRQIGNAVPTVFGEILGKMIVAFLRNFPRTQAIKIDFPKMFTAFIDYTKRDHERNAESRTVHKHFNHGQ